jgi:SAM-dependent methyltransferase
MPARRSIGVVRASSQWLGALYRYVEAVLSPFSALAAARGYPRFFRDRRHYVAMSGSAPLRRRDDYPCLLDWTETTPFDPHYTYQDGWAARRIAERLPAEHVDVGSRVSFVVGLSAFVPVTFVDLRPLELALSGLTNLRGDLLSLPFADCSVQSLSCLHVAEHVGLGRYGDELDPGGTRRAARELERVLALGGHLYFSLPVGRPRTEFNAHRIHDPLEIPLMFPELRLAEFAGVNDAGEFSSALGPGDLAGSRWGCGLYVFVRD